MDGVPEWVQEEGETKDFRNAMPQEIQAPSVPDESFQDSSPSTSPPSSSPPSSYQKPSSIHKYSPPRQIVSSLPESTHNGNSGASVSPRLWRKLKNLGSKVVDREGKQQ